MSSTGRVEEKVFVEDSWSWGESLAAPIASIKILFRDDGSWTVHVNNKLQENGHAVINVQDLQQSLNKGFKWLGPYQKHMNQIREKFYKKQRG